MGASDAGVASVLITERLSRRRQRAAHDRGEQRAFTALAKNLSRAPARVPQRLVNTALDLCDAGSAGISVLSRKPQGDYLHWSAVAGQLAGQANVVTPRNFSPCGTALEVNAGQLFHCPGRFFTYLNGLGALVVELLVVPIQTEEQALGTLWVASHEADEREFDVNDLRIMVGLAEFAAVALRFGDTANSAGLIRQDSGQAVDLQPPTARWWPPPSHKSASRWGRRLAQTLGIH